MTKAELVKRVFKDTKFRGIPKVAVEEMLETAFELLSKSIQKDGKFTYPGFGSFNLRKRKARKARNPQTGELIQVSSRKTVSFKPAPQLKQSLK